MNIFLVVEDFKSLKATEMEKEIEQGDKLRREVEVSRHDEEHLEKRSGHLKRQILDLQRKTSSSEKCLMESKRHSTELQHSCLQEKQKAEYDAHMEMKQSNEDLQALNHECDKLTKKCENLRLAMKKKILRLKESQQNELQYSRNKIKAIIKKKESDLSEKRTILLKLKKSIAQKEEDLNERRKKQLLGLDQD